jgi:hypothetical protein
MIPVPKPEQPADRIATAGRFTTSGILTTWTTRYEMLILRYTRYILVYLSMSISYLVYTELCWVYRGMGDFIDTQFCCTLEWFSNVWICKHTCPITRHRDLESKAKKLCTDFDSRILTSYRYIPVYTEYNLVYTMRIQNQGQLSCFLLHGSVLLLDHAIIHPPWSV